MPPKKQLQMSVQVPVKTYLSSRGYAIAKTPETEALLDDLRKELTVKPFVNPNMPNANDVQPFPVFRESSSKFYMPRIYGVQRFGVPQVNKLSAGEDANIVFNGSLREEQQLPVQAFLNAARDPSKMGGILEMRCAAGKTVMALYIASVLKKKTLIVCHKEFLMNQWRERIQQFLPTTTVGIIKQSKVEVDKDIVIASLQSLCMRDYDESIFEKFGFVTLDECHHMGAEVFSRAFYKICSPVMLGLSATVKRKDGLSKVFEWYIGKPVYTLRKRDDPEVTVIPIMYTHNSKYYGKEIQMFNGKLNIASMITALTVFGPRNERIVEEWRKLHGKEPERRLLILSERRAHLDALKEWFDRIGTLGTTGYYVGGMSEAQLKESEKAQIILATYAMAAEGMDIPALDTLILASPVSAIEQPVGRILRQKPEDRKHIPTIVDVIDDFSMFAGQGKKRLAFYKKQGYAITGTASCREVMQETQTALDNVCLLRNVEE
jgi:superfamily II DNA or RNA helicase